MHTGWQAERIAPYVEPRSRVQVDERSHQITARIWRSQNEVNQGQSTLLHAVTSKGSLEHAHYVFTDIPSVPTYRKLAVLADDHYESWAPHLSRFNETAVYARWSDRDIVAAWIQTDDESRVSMGPSLSSDRALGE